ncbi:hypothetical protein P3S67_011131 [Capsicum chacoense]
MRSSLKVVPALRCQALLESSGSLSALWYESTVFVTNQQDTSEALKRSTRGKQLPKYLDHYVVPNPKGVSPLPSC